MEFHTDRARLLYQAQLRQERKLAAQKRRKRELDVNDIIDRVHRENRGQRVFTRVIDIPAAQHTRQR